ncbi:MAG: hypothetical protein RLY20_282 [Verrucomicrobiota bacterium]|jgi:hypothetical protein
MALDRPKFVTVRCLALLLPLLLLALPSWAEQIKLDTMKVGSRVYKRVTILGFNATDVYFTHTQGISNAKLRNLEPDLQKLFHYDENEATAAEQQQVIDNEEFNKQVVVTIEENARSAAEMKRRKDMTCEESLADPLSEKSPIGRELPEVKVDRWIGNKPEPRGKFQLIYLWAPWSMASKKFMPDMNTLHGRFGRDLVFFGIVSEKSYDPESDSGTPSDFPTGIDASATLVNNLGVTSVPQVVLVDPKGIVRYLGNPGTLTDKRLEELVKKFGQ